jgi:hypothetical protein
MQDVVEKLKAAAQVVSAIFVDDFNPEEFNKP